MASTANFRKGMHIRFNGALHVIIDFQHVKPGKGGAFVRTKLKKVRTGKVIDNTFNAGAEVEEVRVERRKHQYLYRTGTLYHFMDTTTYEQLALEEALVSEHTVLMKEGLTVEMLLELTEKQRVISCELPASVVLKVSYAEPGVKGDTATTATKKARLETGHTLQVPLFIEEGDVIRIDTRTKKYQERVTI